MLENKKNECEYNKGLQYGTVQYNTTTTDCLHKVIFFGSSLYHHFTVISLFDIICSGLQFLAPV